VCHVVQGYPGLRLIETQRWNRMPTRRRTTKKPRCRGGPALLAGVALQGPESAHLVLGQQCSVPTAAHAPPPSSHPRSRRPSHQTQAQSWALPGLALLLLLLGGQHMTGGHSLHCPCWAAGTERSWGPDCPAVAMCADPQTTPGWLCGHCIAARSGEATASGKASAAGGTAAAMGDPTLPTDDIPTLPNGCKLLLPIAARPAVAAALP